MHAIRVFLFNILFFAGVFLFALVGLAFSFGPGGQARVRWFLRRCANYVQNLVWLVLGGRIEVRGLEHVTDKPALIVPKHLSELDVFIPLGLYPDIAAVAMEELTRYPLLGPVLRKLDFILVSVEGQKLSQLRQVKSGAQRVHRQGRPILIYPEGELMRLGGRESYKTGVYHIYKATGAPVTPVAQSLGLIWPQRRWWKDIGQTGVWEFLEPIPPGLDRDTFMAELERRIEDRTMALIREHARPEILAEAERVHHLGYSNAEAPAGGRREDAPAAAPRPRAGEAPPKDGKGDRVDGGDGDG